MPEENAVVNSAESLVVEDGEASAVAESPSTSSLPVSCPPPAPLPERREFDPRARLLELAGELVRTQNRRLMAEYLRLRRTVR